MKIIQMNKSNPLVSNGVPPMVSSAVKQNTPLGFKLFYFVWNCRRFGTAQGSKVRLNSIKSYAMPWHAIYFEYRSLD